MERIIILAAGAAIVLSCLAMGFALMRVRRPPLRLPHEETLEERGDGLYRVDPPEELDLHRLAEMIEHLPPGPRLPARYGPAVIDHDPDEDVAPPSGDPVKRPTEKSAR